jgi:hypothetical protein
MIPKKPAPDLIRGGRRFSEKIMLQRSVIPLKTAKVPGPLVRACFLVVIGLDNFVPMLHRIRPAGAAFLEVNSMGSARERGAHADSGRLYFACISIDIYKRAAAHAHRPRFREISNDLQAPSRCGATNRLILPRHVIASVLLGGYASVRESDSWFLAP